MTLPEVLFPYETVRNVQSQLIDDILLAIKQRKHILAHAPTGLGKTVAALAPALSIAEKEDLTIFFLTSRHTQHEIAIETLSSIKKRFGFALPSISIIGKRWMCLQPGIGKADSSGFLEWCKYLRESGSCEFYSNTYDPSTTRDGTHPSIKAQQVSLDLAERTPISAKQIINICSQHKLCPYELAIEAASKSRVIVTDYYYVFNPVVANSFFNKLRKSLSNIILIVDEGHNLPSRVREQLSSSISLTTLWLAKKEVRECSELEYIPPIIRDGVTDSLDELTLILESLVEHDIEERVVKKEEFLDQLQSFKPIQLIQQEMYPIAAIALSNKKRSFISHIINFISEWQGGEKGYLRFARRSRQKDSSMNTTLYKNCLDPSLVTAEIIEKTYASVIMSGTLTPTTMYSDLLGISPKRGIQKEYSSPFDQANRLALVVPKTTTQFSKRSDEQFMKIAQTSSEICNLTPGNVAVFFPSYSLRNSVNTYFSTLCNKTVFTEETGMSSGERAEMIERFKGYCHQGAVLLGVAAGSFGEGIDLPGKLLNGVVVVGLPLAKPDLETKALIDYYDEKFGPGKGWDYGYVLPAITKTLQNAGRCIRTETDRGVVVFLDERYAWPCYLKCFPASWNPRITMDYKTEIEKFFGKIV